MAAPDASEALIARFPAALVPPGGVVAGYVPFHSEIDPRPLMRALAARCARLCLPVAPTRGSDAPLSFRAWREGEPLERGGFGVPEPEPGAALVGPDLLLVPLLAFDRAGGRLGYGAGHYDRTLAILRARRPIIALGLAYAAQEVERVPTEPHDARLDGIVTERAYIAVSGE